MINQKYNISIRFGVIKTMLISLYNGEKMAKSFFDIIKKYRSNNEEILLYSYWCNDAAIALSFLSKKDDKICAICRIHGWDVFFYRSNFNYLPYRTFIQENMRSIYSISKAGVEYCKIFWKVKADNIVLSRLGVPPRKTFLRRADVFTVASCSNVIPVKEYI